MPIRSDREYRNSGSFEAQDDYWVEGYASTFDRYVLYEFDGNQYFEQIDRNAFDKADLSDVVLLRDHQGRVLARTKNGSLQLSVDEHGLKVRANLGLTEAGREMYEDIKVKNYTQMSFSFTVEDEEYDKSTRTRFLRGLKKLFDVSVVAFPANNYTEIGLSARDIFNGVIEEEKAERLEREKRDRARQVLAVRIKIMKGEIHGNQRDENR